jgi:hemerythrin-like domain-containing protein
MKITETLATEHAVFRRLFDQLEAMLPGLRTAGEVRVLAQLTEGLLRTHGQAEDEWLLPALDHCLEDLGQRETLFQQHAEVDARWKQACGADRLGSARQLLRDALAYSRRHFEHEESQVFPLVERVMQHASLTKLDQARLQPAQASSFWSIGT